MQKPHFYERSIKTESIDLGLRAIIQWIYRDGYCERYACGLFAMSHADCSQCPMRIVRNVPCKMYMMARESQLKR